ATHGTGASSHAAGGAGHGADRVAAAAGGLTPVAGRVYAAGGWGVSASADDGRTWTQLAGHPTRAEPDGVAAYRGALWTVTPRGPLTRPDTAVRRRGIPERESAERVLAGRGERQADEVGRRVRRVRRGQLPAVTGDDRPAEQESERVAVRGGRVVVAAGPGE